MITHHPFGKSLKHLMAIRNLSTKDTAKMLCIDHSLIKKWISGTRIPSLSSIYYDSICHALNLDQQERFNLKEAQIYSLDETAVSHRAAQKVIYTEQAFNFLLNAITDFAAFINPQGIIIDINKAFADYLSIPNDHLIAQCLYDILACELSETFKEAVKKVISTSLPAEFKEYYNLRWIVYSLYPLTENTEQIDKIAIICKDITAETNMFNILKTSEERHRLLFYYNMDPTLLTRPDGSIIAANPAACTFFQMTEKEICSIGRNGIMDVTDTNLQPSLNERKTNGKIRTRLNVVKKDGTKVSAEVISAQFATSNYKLESYVIIRPLIILTKAITNPL